MLSLSRGTAGAPRPLRDSGLDPDTAPAAEQDAVAVDGGSATDSGRPAPGEGTADMRPSDARADAPRIPDSELASDSGSAPSVDVSRIGDATAPPNDASLPIERDAAADCTGQAPTSWTFNARTLLSNAFARSRCYPRLVPHAAGVGAFWLEQHEGSWQLRFAELSPAGAIVTGPTTVYVYQAALALGWKAPQKKVFDVAVDETGDRYGVALLDDRDGNYDVYFIRVERTNPRQATPRRVTDTATASKDSTGDISLAARGSGYLLLRGDDCIYMGSPGHYCRYITALDAKGSRLSDPNVFVVHYGYHCVGMRPGRAATQSNTSSAA